VLEPRCGVDQLEAGEFLAAPPPGGRVNLAENTERGSAGAEGGRWCPSSPHPPIPLPGTHRGAYACRCPAGAGGQRAGVRVACPAGAGGVSTAGSRGVCAGQPSRAARGCGVVSCAA